MTKRPDGRYMMQIDVGRDPETGKRVRKTVYGKTKKEVEDKKRKIMNEIAAGRDLRQRMPTVSEWIDRYVSVYYANDTSSMRIRHDNAARAIKQYYKDMPISDMRRSDVAMFANSISERSLSYVASVRSLLTSAMDAAVDDRIIISNPMRNLRWTHAEPGTHRALTAEEMEIIENIPTCAEGIASLIMMYCGLRIGEYAALRWRDIEDGVIHVRATIKKDAKQRVGKPKTRSSYRDVPVPRSLSRILEMYRADPDIYLCNGITEPSNITTIESRMTRFYRSININIRPHDLRHTYATILYDAGVDVKTAQSLLGHSSPKITMDIYTHLSESRKNNSIDKLNDYIDAKKTTNSR